jgi:hypothetical protein
MHPRLQPCSLDAHDDCRPRGRQVAGEQLERKEVPHQLRGGHRQERAPQWSRSKLPCHRCGCLTQQVNTPEFQPVGCTPRFTDPEYARQSGCSTRGPQQAHGTPATPLSHLSAHTHQQRKHALHGRLNVTRCWRRSRRHETLAVVLDLLGDALHESLEGVHVIGLRGQATRACALG